MQLLTLLEPWIGEAERLQAQGKETTGLQLDSRKVAAGDLFLALPGCLEHGLAHAQQAIANGAMAVAFDPAGLAERPPAQLGGVPLLAIEGLWMQAGAVAARFYGHPASDMAIIGITGTNGKTSCSQFLGQLLNDCAVIGTLGWGSKGRLTPTLNTTPDAVSLQAMFSALKNQKMKAVALEVSSHGLKQGRVNSVNFKGAVITNISRDHLDYHGDMDAYVETKLELLKMPGLAFAAVNLDDAYSERIVAAVPAGVTLWGFSRNGRTLDSGETLQAELLRHQRQGVDVALSWRDRREQVCLPLYGEFNIDNALAVLAVLLAMGGEFAESARKLASLKAVPGRMERFGGDGQPLAFVDYAHTPDALEKVLTSARRHCPGKLWVVFGCGGNRDAGKRPVMRQAAERMADVVVITDDNPRFENGLAIINDIMTGSRAGNIQIIEDRQEAIEDVIARADCEDCIVIAGKGHEDYQEIKGERIPFSDRLVVVDALTKRSERHANVVN